MSKKLLNEIKMGGNGCSSYLGSVDGVLRAAGLWNEDFYKLAGMTGIAFHFIVHEQVCPSGVTVYDWQQKHFTMIDKIGVQSEVFQYYYNNGLNTYDKVLQLAVQRIKDSIDRGKGVVIWAPTPILEFGIITGYDDDDQVFFVEDCSCTGDADPLLYKNIGKADAPILFYQIFYEREDVDYKKVYLQSLDFAVKEWEKEFHMNPHYKSGRKAYHNLINALEKGDYNSFGLSYIVFSYSKAKECIARYLDFLKDQGGIFSGLERAVQLYKEIDEKYNKMEELIPFTGPGTEIDQGLVPDVKSLCKEVFELEEKAVDFIKEILNK